MSNKKCVFMSTDSDHAFTNNIYAPHGIHKCVSFLLVAPHERQPKKKKYKGFYKVKVVRIGSAFCQAISCYLIVSQFI